MLEISFIPQLCICMIEVSLWYITDLLRYQFTQLESLVKIKQWRQYQTIQNHFFFKLAVRPRGPPWNWVVLSLQYMEEKRFLLEPIYFDFVVVFLFVFFFVKGAFFLKVCLALYVSLCLFSSKEEACTWETSPSRCPPLLHLRLLLRSDFRLLLDL